MEITEKDVRYETGLYAEKIQEALRKAVEKYGAPSNSKGTISDGVNTQKSPISQNVSFTQRDVMCMFMKLRRLDSLEWALHENQPVDSIKHECAECPYKPECWKSEPINSVLLHLKLSRATGLRSCTI